MANNYVIDLAIPSLAVEGSDARFPVGRIYCVGRNYADHAREMGHDPDREPPFFFMKAANSVVPSGATWSRRSARAARTSPWKKRWNMCGATPWAWT
jgi:2-keto-4-pentenoate hydratase/2-oxohepta-3-ene-1,7-dioic acid hydratase in catechol pathway